MLKKSALLGIALSTMMVGSALALTMPEKTTQLDSRKALSAAAASASASAVAQPVYLDRTGVDRASIHLQILQQTTTHFAETCPDKKNSADEMSGGRAVMKPASQS
ncbi:hypothetical protein [Undibacterium terreum]|uniref:Uncharacterized protein n=1 Tax=Undibacterium terreum TaxID=1224302 RepID=A0A916U473_9BURK|nr:hypothetical protein [Undibacterium terreum]GGC58665.1 hypothetical protein GCM10011396_01960 [Undibacterium terreum]